MELVIPQDLLHDLKNDEDVKDEVIDESSQYADLTVEHKMLAEVTLTRLRALVTLENYQKKNKVRKLARKLRK